MWKNNLHIFIDISAWYVKMLLLKGGVFLAYQAVFKRYEMKYLLTQEQKERLDSQNPLNGAADAE